MDDRQGGIIICRVCEPNESVPVGDLLRRGRRVGIEGPSSHSTAASRIRIGLPSVVGMDCRELLVEWILFEWALSSRALGHGEWPGSQVNKQCQGWEEEPKTYQILDKS